MCLHRAPLRPAHSWGVLVSVVCILCVLCVSGDTTCDDTKSICANYASKASSIETTTSLSYTGNGLTCLPDCIGSLTALTAL